jgi:hypothetical protein
MCHCEPFAFCHSERSEESHYFAQDKLREGRNDPRRFAPRNDYFSGPFTIIQKVKLPAHRAGLPGNVSSFHIVPLDPAYPAKARRGTFRSTRIMRTRGILYCRLFSMTHHPDVQLYPPTQKTTGFAGG